MATVANHVGAPAPTRQRSKGLSEKRLAVLMVSPVDDPHRDRGGMADHLRDLVVAAPVQRPRRGPVALGGRGQLLHERVCRILTGARRSYHTLIFTVISVTLELVIGLGMALAMHAAFRGQGLLRTVVLVPWAVLTVVTAVMWRTMFVSPYGFVQHDPRAPTRCGSGTSRTR